MEVKCPKCYKGTIKNGCPLITQHNHYGYDNTTYPVGIKIDGTFHRMYVDVCKKCGHAIRFYWK